jgi:hypothetical protein
VDASGGKENPKENPMKRLLFFATFLWLILSLQAQAHDKPAWINRKPQDTAEMSYFDSFVDERVSEDDAILSATNNVNNAVANAAIVYIQSLVSERFRSTESQSTFTIDIETESYTDIILTGIKIETYCEWYSNRSNQQKCRAWALATVSKAQMERDRRSYMETIAQRYTLDSTIQGDNLSSALSAYNTVYQALERNPLHRTIAVYGEGQSLFEYCRQKMNEITDSLLFDDIPPQYIQKGGTLAIPVSISSSLFSKTGTLECIVTLQGERGIMQGGVYTVDSNNSFVLRIPASGLTMGNYAVSLELGMNVITSSVVRNPKINFRLEVRPAIAEIRFEGDSISEREEEILIDSIRRGIENNETPLVLNTTRTAGNEKRCEFIVTLRKTEYPVTGIIGYYITLAFAQGEQIYVSAKSFEKRDYSIDLLFRRFIADHISNYRQFFQDVNALLERN